MFQVDLPPEVESRLYEESVRQGVSASDIARHLIETNLPASAAPVLTEKQKAAIALLDSWQAEYAAADPADLERREAELQEFAANMNANRAAEGRAPVFP